jgi:non-specific serine/threonine protein kinase
VRISAAEARGFDAVALFVTRAKARSHTFALTDANAAEVVEICRRLDGIPLAIELAAGRASSLTLDEIRRRVDERFQLLVGGGPTARQQTMRAAIDWSHDQLVAPERALFRRLSVFVGSFSVDAVDAVCAFGDLEPQTVFDLLARLTGKSLVSRSDGRHRLLETIRDYARERLHEAGEADAVAGRQAAFFRDLTALPAPGAMADWLAALDADRDNLRAAFTWYLDTDPATAAAMARRCYDFWYLRGYTTEARQVLDALLARLPAGADGRAAVECDAGRFAYVQGDQSAAQAHLAAARELAERTGDQATVARALRAEGVVALAAGQPADAEAAFEQSLSIWRDVADTGEEAETLHQLGLVVGGRGDVGDALALLRRSLELRRRLGREEEATMTLTFLAAVEVAMGDHATARDHIAAALAACDRLGDRRATWAIDVLGCIVASEGRNDVAVRLWSAAAGIHRGVGTAPPAIWFALLDAYRKPALAALGDTATEVEAAGAALGFEAAMALAADAIRAPSPAT